MTTFMTDALRRLYFEEEGQGLVEYALLIALIAFASVAGMGQLASSINSAFNRISSYLGKYVS